MTMHFKRINSQREETFLRLEIIFKGLAWLDKENQYPLSSWRWWCAYTFIYTNTTSQITVSHTIFPMAHRNSLVSLFPKQSFKPNPFQMTNDSKRVRLPCLTKRILNIGPRWVEKMFARAVSSLFYVTSHDEPLYTFIKNSPNYSIKMIMIICIQIFDITRVFRNPPFEQKYLILTSIPNCATQIDPFQKNILKKYLKREENWYDGYAYIIYSRNEKVSSSDRRGIIFAQNPAPFSVYIFFSMWHKWPFIIIRRAH